VSLDYLMIVLACLVCVGAFVFKAGRFVTLLILFSLIYNVEIVQIVLTGNRIEYFKTAPIWLTLFFLKDITIWLIIGIRSRAIELTFFLSFIASSLFHQAALYQVLNHHAELLSYRPAFMTYLTAIQLASVIYIIIQGSTWNGGKRIANTDFYMLYSYINRLFYIQAYRVKK